MTIDEFCETWEAMLTDDSIWKGAVELTADKVVQVNKEHLLEGMGSDGVPLPVYAHYTMSSGLLYGDYKSQRNSRNGGRWDMNFTGNSFMTMKGYFEGDRFKIDGEGFAAAYHRGSLGRGKGTGRIFGLYESDHMLYYRQQYLYPLIVDLIKAYTGVR